MYKLLSVYQAFLLWPFEQKARQANACIQVRARVLSWVSIYMWFSPFARSGPIPPLLCSLGHAPELCYNNNYNGFDSLMSIAQEGAVTEISKFCQQLSSEVVGA